MGIYTPRAFKYSSLASIFDINRIGEMVKMLTQQLLRFNYDQKKEEKLSEQKCSHIKFGFRSSFLGPAALSSAPFKFAIFQVLN